MQSFKELKVWQQAHALSLDVYRLTKAFPLDERFGLTSQLRRGAVSIECNIAEGSKRIHRTDYARFINVAEGSLAEVQCLLLLARDLGYSDHGEALDRRMRELAAMLNALRQRVEAAA